MTVAGIKALIFDMDGVIVDSEPLHLLAYQELLGRYNLPYSEDDNRQFLGRKDIEMASILVPRYNLPIAPQVLVEAKEQILARLFAEQSVPRPGLYELLDKAQSLRLPVGVASSATLPTIQLVIDTLGVRKYFQALTSGDEVPRGKPAPDVFLLAAKRLATEPASCLVIEDTAAGIKAAKAAGMFCVSIPCDATRHEDHSHADLHLQSLAQIELAGMVAASISKH